MSQAKPFRHLRSHSCNEPTSSQQLPFRHMARQAQVSSTRAVRKEGEGVRGAILNQAEHEELPASQHGLPVERIPNANPIPSFSLSGVMLAPLGHHT